MVSDFMTTLGNGFSEPINAVATPEFPGGGGSAAEAGTPGRKFAETFHCHERPGGAR